MRGLRRFDDFEANGHIAVEIVTIDAGSVIVHDAVLFQTKYLLIDLTIPPRRSSNR